VRVNVVGGVGVWKKAGFGEWMERRTRRRQWFLKRIIDRKQ
jgi:hypothetical protein